MCNAHEILWKVAGTLRVLRKILFLLFDTFLYDLLIMQKSAFLAL
jgi:hypothetical protein